MRSSNGAIREELFTAEQAAAILQLTLKTMKAWLRAGKLAGDKMGRVWRVREAVLEALIQASHVLCAREE